jgi:hypothetical protein
MAQFLVRRRVNGFGEGGGRERQRAEFVSDFAVEDPGVVPGRPIPATGRIGRRLKLSNGLGAIFCTFAKTLACAGGKPIDN